ncbi:MAG: CSLREA domain-containing protein [Planctomycetaceae bacterium]
MARRNSWTWLLKSIPANLSLLRSGALSARNRPGRYATEFLEERRLLTAYVVDTLDDDPAGGTGDTDGFISLREAVQAANTNAVFGDAPAGNSGAVDTISLSATLNGNSIFLGGSQLIISDALSIAGPGADLLTIDAIGNSRVFLVNAGFDAEISV